MPLLPLAALVWPPEASEFTVKYRPITRLITWWSLGIPTIYYPYQSYLDVASRISRPLIARHLGEIDAHLDWLLNPSNEHAVRALVREQSAVASSFTLDALLPTYKRNLCDARGLPLPIEHHHEHSTADGRPQAGDRDAGDSRDDVKQQRRPDNILLTQDGWPLQSERSLDAAQGVLRGGR